MAAQQDHGFLHLVQRLRDEREERIAKQPIIDELAAAGVKILDRPRWSDPVKPLEQLGTSDDPLTPEAHASCNGHVAWIDEEWTQLGDNNDSSDDGEDGYELTYVAVYGCSDPVAYGHVEPTTTALRSSRNGSQISDQEAKAERQRVLRNNKAWRAAEVVRLDWLKTFVARKSAPKNAQRFIFSELAIGGYQLCDAMQKHHRFGRELLGTIDDGALIATLKNAGDARAQMITLALVLGAHEADLGVHTWRSRNRAAERYLSHISSWGYELSEIEQSVIKDGPDDE